MVEKPLAGRDPHVVAPPVHPGSPSGASVAERRRFFRPAGSQAPQSVLSFFFFFLFFLVSLRVPYGEPRCPSKPETALVGPNLTRPNPTLTRRKP